MALPTIRVGGTALVLLTLSGCITRSEHDRLMGEAQQAFQRAAQGYQGQIATKDQEITDLQTRIGLLEAEIAQRDQRIGEEQAKVADLQRKLDDAVALGEQLRGTLERAGKSVDKLLAEKGDLSKALQDSKDRLEELRRAQAAAQKRADLFKSLVLKFKKMIDAGDLAIVLRDGRMVLQLRNEVLFDPGRVDIKPAGKDALKEVATILTTLEQRKLQVAGHTDNVPISTGRFPSNWELSTARAVNVVKFLVEQGVAPGELSAAGYGEYDPVASNDDRAGKAKNRRIEIVLQPNIAELVQVPTDP
ncbi:MAG: OmpA family protein [Myxococcota bacterium]